MLQQFDDKDVDSTMKKSIVSIKLEIKLNFHGNDMFEHRQLMKYAEFSSADKSSSMWKEMHSGIKL